MATRLLPPIRAGFRSKRMIPNRIHFIFGLDLEFGGKPFSLIHFLAILSAKKVNQPGEIVFHYEHQPDGEWWERAKPFLTLDPVHAPRYFDGRALEKFAHRADVLRLQILLAEGGIYLDADTFCVTPFTPLLNESTVLGVEPNAGLSNAVILAQKEAPFLRLWLDTYSSFDSKDWRSHSIRMPYRLSKRHEDLLRVEGGQAFCFPTYDDPMHVSLWQESVSLGQRVSGLARVLRDIPYYLSEDWPVSFTPYLRSVLARRTDFYRRLRTAYCLHLWESLWWDRYLRDLTLEALSNRPTLFAALVADILGEDFRLSPVVPKGGGVIGDVRGRTPRSHAHPDREV